MGNACANELATAVGASPENPDELTKPKKKRSMVGNMVHNVKKQMSPKPKWNNSKPEKDKVRKNHRELDDHVEKRKPQPEKPKKHQKPKAYNQSDGVLDDGFAPEAGIYGDGGHKGGEGGYHGSEGAFGHGGFGGDARGDGGDGGDGGDAPF